MLSIGDTAILSLSTPYRATATVTRRATGVSRSSPRKARSFTATTRWEPWSPFPPGSARRSRGHPRLPAVALVRSVRTSLLVSFDWTDGTFSWPFMLWPQSVCPTNGSKSSSMHPRTTWRVCSGCGRTSRSVPPRTWLSWRRTRSRRLAPSCSTRTPTAPPGRCSRHCAYSLLP